MTGDLQAGALHGARDVIPDAGLRGGTRGVGLRRDRAEVLAEGLAAGQFEEAGLAGELPFGAVAGEAGQGGFLKGRGGEDRDERQQAREGGEGSGGTGEG